MKVYTQKARASKMERKCHRCGYVVQRGEVYRSIWPRGSKNGVHFCYQHHPRPSELVGGKLSEACALQDGLQDDLAGFLDESLDMGSLKAALEAAAEEAENLAVQYNEADANIEEHFSSSPTADDCRERADTLTEWAEELRSAAGEIEDDAEPEGLCDRDTCTCGAEEEAGHADDCLIHEDVHDDTCPVYEDNINSAREEAASTAEEAISSLSL